MISIPMSLNSPALLVAQTPGGLPADFSVPVPEHENASPEGGNSQFGKVILIEHLYYIIPMPGRAVILRSGSARDDNPFCHPEAGFSAEGSRF